METKISAERLKKLERMEAKLNALEAGGVDNWDYHDDALREYYLENEIEERMDNLIGDLEQAFGECAYEPSERGAGIAFNEGVASDVIKILNAHKVTFSDLGEGE